MALTWQGQLDDAEQLLTEIGDLGLAEDPWWGDASGRSPSPAVTSRQPLRVMPEDGAKS